jgi:hypothetical protein
MKKTYLYHLNTKNTCFSFFYKIKKMKKNKIFKVILNLIDIITIVIPLVILIINYVKYAVANYIETSVYTESLVQKNITVKVNVNVSSLDLTKCTENSYEEYKSLKNNIARFSIQIWLSVIASLSVSIFNSFFKPKFDDDSRVKRTFKKFVYWLTKCSIKIYIFPGIELFNIISFEDCIIIEENWVFNLDSSDTFDVKNMDFLNLIFFISFGFFFIMILIMVCLFPLFDMMLSGKENWTRRKTFKLVAIFTYYISTSTYFIFSSIAYVESFYSKYLAPGSFTINLIIEIFYTISDRLEKCCCC